MTVIRTPHGLLDLRALDSWTRANARSRAEYADHTVVAGGTNRYLKACDHCTAAKEKPMSETIRGPRVHRPAASATWEHEHRWGSQLGDSTRLSVTRTDGSGMRLAYGKESVEVRDELVPILAAMVVAAAEWTDAKTGETP